MKATTALACLALALAALCAPAAAGGAVGDIYYADEDSNVSLPGSGGVFRISPAGAVSVVATDPAFSNPGGLALLPDGRLAVPDYSATPPRVALVNPATGQVSTLASGPPLVDPYDAAMAADGSLYVTDHGADRLFKIDLRTGAVAPFAVLPPAVGFGSAVVPQHYGGAIVAVAGQLLRVESGRVWPINTTSPLISHTYDLALTADQRTLYAANAPSQVLSRTALPDGEPQLFVSQQDARTIALRPDGSLLLGEFNGTIFNVPAAGSPITPFVTDDRFEYGRGLAIEHPLCAGRRPTVVGTTGNDRLGGSGWPDVFLPLGGKDGVVAWQGNDVICGGAGNDIIRGGPGKDRLLGGPGNDKLFGQGGNDRIFGQAGNDRLFGDRGKDRLKGGKGKDKEKP